jgi:hypothetical protein
MIVSKDSTPEQKEALRQALRQHSLQMAVRGATPEGIESLPEDFEPPSYSENTRPLYDGQLFPQIVSADDLIANGYAHLRRLAHLTMTTRSTKLVGQCSPTVLICLNQRT